MYIRFVMSEPESATCSRLSEVMGLSHVSVNRFLLRKHYEPKDLFEEAQRRLILAGGTLSLDDSVLDRPYRRAVELVGYFWSGKHHRVVKGLNLTTLFYTDPEGRSLPVNDRVYAPAESQTKNDYFRTMLAEVLAWELQPRFVNGDCWYSSGDNLRRLRHLHAGFLFAVESNRRVSIERDTWTPVGRLNIPAEGRLGLAARIRRSEAVSDLVERPATPLRDFPAGARCLRHLRNRRLRLASRP